MSQWKDNNSSMFPSTDHSASAFVVPTMLTPVKELAIESTSSSDSLLVAPRYSFKKQSKSFEQAKQGDVMSMIMFLEFFVRCFEVVI